MKHSAFRLALLTGVAVAALTPSMANAWTMTTHGDGAERYCAISQKSKQGSVATYALNVQSQTSFALDFQKKRFDGDRPITITFASGTWTRTVKTTPISPTTFVIPLGDDPVFDKELRQGEILSVRIDDETQTVPLDGFGTVRTTLDRCLLEKTAAPPPQPTVQPAAPAPKEQTTTQAPTPPAPSAASAPKSTDALSIAEENRTLRQALETQRRALEEARAGAPGSPALQDLTAQIQSLEARNRALEASVNSTRPPAPAPELEKLAAENKALMAEIERLRSAPPPPAPPSPPADQIQKLTDQMQSLRAQNDQLAQQLIRAEEERDSALSAAASVPPPPVQRADPDITHSEIMTLRAENASLVRELAELRTDQAAHLANPTDSIEITTLREQVARLQADKITLEQALTATQANDPNVGDLASTRAPVRRQLRELMAENGALQAQLKNLSEELEVLRMRAESKELSFAGDNWNAELATRRYQEAEREIQRLGRTLRDQQERCAAEKKEIEYMLFDPKISNSAQNALVSSLQDKISSMELELKTLRSAASSGLEASAPIINGIDPQTVNDLKEAHQRELDTLQARIALLETEHRKAQQHLSDVSREPKTVDTGDNAAARERLERLENDLASAQEEASRLRDQNQSLIQRVSSLAATAPRPASPPVTVAADTPPPVPARAVLPPPSSAAQNIQSDLQTPMGAIVGMPRPPVAPGPSSDAPADVSDSVRRLLQDVGVPADVQVVTRKAGPKTIYEWSEGAARAFLHQEKLIASSTLDSIVESYLGAMEQKCDGEFAVLPSTLDIGDDPTRQAYETACASGADPSSVQSAALLFSLQGNQLRTLTVGSPANVMDEAMRLRDRFASQL